MLMLEHYLTFFFLPGRGAGIHVCVGSGSEVNWACVSESVSEQKGLL